MNKKTLGGILLVLGLVLIVAGLVLMLVIVPGMKQFPDNVDTTRVYAGSMETLLVPPQPGGDLVFLHGLEVTLTRRFYTEATDGDLALVVEEQELKSNDGAVTIPLLKRQAIDRKTMEFTENIPADWAEKEGIYQRGGLVLGWPIDSEKKDYDGWNDDYRVKVPLTFEGEVEHPRAKMNTYYFRSESEAQPIVPEQVAAMRMPTEISQEQLLGLLSGMEGISPEIGELLGTLIATAWPDPVPLEYTYAYEGEYWVEPVTGVLIDTHKVEVRQVSVPEELLDALLGPLEMLAAAAGSEQAMPDLLPMPVYQLDYQATDQTVEDAKADAEDAKSQIELFGSTLPLVGIVGGLVIGVAGLFLFLQKSS